MIVVATSSRLVEPIAGTIGPNISRVMTSASRGELRTRYGANSRVVARRQ